MDGADVAIAADSIVAGRIDVGSHGAPPYRAGTPGLTLSPGTTLGLPAETRQHAPRASGILPKAEKSEQLPSFIFARRPMATRPGPGSRPDPPATDESPCAAFLIPRP